MAELSTPTQVKEFFLNDKPVAALIAVKRNNTHMSGTECYGRKVSLKIDSTYAHTVKTLAKMQKLGLTESEKKGRKKVHRLTPLGEKYAEIFERLLNNLEQDFGVDDVTLDAALVDGEGDVHPPQMRP